LHHHFRRTTLITWLCVGVLAGLCAGHTGMHLALGWLLVGSGVLCAGRRTVLGVGAVMLIGVSAGSIRGYHVAQQITGYQPLYNQKVTLQITAHEDAVYGKNGQFTFVATHVITEQGVELPGQIGVSGLGLNGIYQGDIIMATGKLREGIGSYQGFMSYAQLELVAHHPSIITDIRRTFAAGTLNALPEPLASFCMGLLVGQRATLPDDVKDNLQKIGLTHIIAVSGANLTIMLEASRKILGKSSKRLSVFLSLGLMAVFVLMTGGSASIVRAAFVSTLSVMAAYYGRRARPLLLITFAAAITAFINPIYVWGDASWYLSFLAFFGVLMVSPIFHNRLPDVFARNIVLAIMLESLCAEIMSLPYILYTFGQMSYVGLLANVLVTSMIPYAMLFGFIACLAGTFLWPIAGWFAWPARYLLTYMLDISQIIASWPGVFKSNVWLSAPGAIALYAAIGMLVGLLGFKDSRKSGTITDKEAINPYKNLGRMS
jgi:competence protein ComEC